MGQKRSQGRGVFALIWGRRGQCEWGCDLLFAVSARASFFDFLAKYCIISPEKLTAYKSAFEAILEMVDFRVTEGLTDLRLFAVVASLAQKIATLELCGQSAGLQCVIEPGRSSPYARDSHTRTLSLPWTFMVSYTALLHVVVWGQGSQVIDFMRSLIIQMDFKSLELRLYKAKQLFLFLLEGQTGGAVVPQGCISAEQLLVELKAGGIREEHEEAVRCELRNLHSLDLLDFLAHLPLFIHIHNSVITNPLDDSNNL
ncbi:hypothetical protein P4O66_002280 [Electrophorus voltai]|uniref:Uncharacterized protein n=1 Tax=Electrophorus voltai TaxID=2609070 RepID=A0AAD8YZ07_9TELE|nr:hypothetical protein P4O66_002280 [Electrophorus voltai]